MKTLKKYENVGGSGFIRRLNEIVWRKKSIFGIHHISKLPKRLKKYQHLHNGCSAKCLYKFSVKICFEI
jgi:hypothetical protein